MRVTRVVLLFAALGAGCGTRSILGDDTDSGAPLPVLVRDASPGFDVVLSADGGFQDALPDVLRDACSSAPPDPPPPAGPIPHLCAPATHLRV